MSSDAAFTSRFRRENNRESGTGRVGRNVYDADGNKIERDSTASTRNSSSVSVNVNRFKRDKPETPSSTSGTIADRMNKLQLSSTKKDIENDASSDKDDKDEETETRHSSRQAKKTGAGAASKKRKDKRNLREKRRSTGVVMLGQSVPADEDEQKVMENTKRNMDPENATTTTTAATTGTDSEREQLLKKISEYETLIEEWKDEMAKLKKENESLQLNNQRLRDENSAFLRVVGSLSGGSRK